MKKPLFFLFAGMALVLTGCLLKIQHSKISSDLFILTGFASEIYGTIILVRLIKKENKR